AAGFDVVVFGVAGFGAVAGAAAEVAGFGVAGFGVAGFAAGACVATAVPAAAGDGSVGAGVGAVGTRPTAWAPSVGGGTGITSSALRLITWVKSSKRRMRTKSIAVRSEASTTRQRPSRPLTAVPTGSPRGRTPPSPEVRMRSPSFTGSRPRR